MEQTIASDRALAVTHFRKTVAAVQRQLEEHARALAMASVRQWRAGGVLTSATDVDASLGMFLRC